MRAVLFAALAFGASAGPVRPGLAVMQLRAHASNASTLETAPGTSSLVSMAHECKCHYRGSCSCKASVEFMECISHACSTGLCACKEQQYFTACTSLERACPSLGFDCSGETATCSVTATAAPPPTSPPETLVEDLEDLRKKKCELIEAHHDGWLNADERLAETEALIARKIKRLKELGGTPPDMSCTSGATGTASTNEETPTPKRVPMHRAAPTKGKKPESKAEGIVSILARYWFGSILNIIILIAATVWVYRKHHQLKEEQLKEAGPDPHCGVWSVLCCLCCTPATICCHIDK